MIQSAAAVHEMQPEVRFRNCKRARQNLTTFRPYRIFARLSSPRPRSCQDLPHGPEHIPSPPSSSCYSREGSAAPLHASASDSEARGGPASTPSKDGLWRRLRRGFTDRSDPASVYQQAAARDPFVPHLLPLSDAPVPLPWRISRKLASTLYRDWFCPPSHLPAEILAGITSSLSMIPEVVAFAFLAQVPPKLAIQTSAVLGLITAVLGGRPGMVTGAAGAVATVSRYIVQDYGIPHLFYASIVMGVVQLIVLAVQGHRLIPLIPAPCMQGFCCGLAITIALAQVKSFRKMSSGDMPLCLSPGLAPSAPSAAAGSATGRRLLTAFDVFSHSQYPWVDWREALWMLGTAGLTILAVLAARRLRRSKLFRSNLGRIPPSLLAMIVAAAVEHGIIRAAAGDRTQTIGDVASLDGSLLGSSWSSCPMPSFGSALPEILGLSVTMAAIGLIETVLTQSLLNELTRTPSAFGREVGAQGVANIIVGCFSGMGGCGMIAQSLLNLESGGFLRISALCEAGFLFLTLGAVYKAVNLVPLSALVGIMWLVCVSTFHWPSIPNIIATFTPAFIRTRPFYRRIFPSAERRIVNRVDALIVIAVTAVTLVTDLAIGVGVGVALAGLAYVWHMRHELSISTSTISVAGGVGEGDGSKSDRSTPASDVSDSVKKRTVAAAVVDMTASCAATGEGAASGKRVYHLRGSLFFGSASRLPELLDSEGDPATVVLDISQCEVVDFSALEALDRAVATYQRLGKRLAVEGWQGPSRERSLRAGHLLPHLVHAGL